MSPMRHWVLTSILVAAFGVATGCPSNDSDSDTDDGNECTPGTRGCPCKGDQCDGTLTCISGACVEIPCAPGTLGCPCRTDNTCAVGPSGRLLSCTAGTCQEPACPAGTINCPCSTGGQCTGVGTYCDATNTCRQQPCPVGTLGCPCAGGNVCSGDRAYCDTTEKICKQQACTTGAIGCPCGQNGACTGERTYCDATNVCREQPCPAGTLGCPCAAGDLCSGDRAYCDTTEKICKQQACTTGAIGCPCGQNGACTGERTYCDATNTCREQPCPIGTLGCPCAAGDLCSGDRAYCDTTERICKQQACPAGTIGCPCGQDGACAGERTYCDGSNTCREQPCPAGTLGCPCASGNLCSADRAYCDTTDSICKPMDCPAGTVGCPCNTGGTCTDAQTFCNASNLCQHRECPAGTAGCPCTFSGACGNADLYCDTNSQTCQSISCPVGTTGCACDNGTCDEERAYCDSVNICRLPACVAGTEGCPCTATNRCGINERGEALTCQEGLCALPSCPVGNTGCVCRTGSVCTQASDQCVNGYCAPVDCVPGDLHCACVGSLCASMALMCQDGRCVDNTGYADGPCLATGTCHAGNRCMSGYCVPCNPGTAQCTCTAQGSCVDSLVCKNQLCVPPVISEVPAAPKCYTPCERGFQPESGEYRACPADHLMEGCLGDLKCIQGSCTPETREDVGLCEKEADCPDFQTCIEGRCYSNCDKDEECAEGTGCWHHVCRTPCTATASNVCQEGWYCHTLEGDNGFCLPVVESGAVVQQEVPGSFAIDHTDLAFSNIAIEQGFTITNNADSFQRFRIRKRDHLVGMADATSQPMEDPDDAVTCTPGTDCPLFWLDMGEGATAQRVQEITVGVDGNGGQVTVRIGNAAGSAGVRWRGTLEVINTRMGVQTVRLSYVQRPEGQWSGTMYYFATFGDLNLDAFKALPAVGSGSTVDTKDDPNRQDDVGNAFVQRWGAFRRGRLSWDEFQAVLTATRSESWRWPQVQSACNTAACYLYDGSASGVMEYSSSLDSTPIPTGITELPMALNLRVDAGQNPLLLTGRIESFSALQYAGNSEVTLEFTHDPSTCTREAFDACLTIVKDFHASIPVGGRYVTTASDQTCSKRPNQGYELTAVPWLIPGFERATEVDPTTSVRYRYECRDKMLPFGTTEAEKLANAPFNLALAGSNPVPDGRTRKRTLSLIDGVMVNQSQIIVLFEEAFGSFLDDTDSAGFKAYGYMVLERSASNLSTEDKNNNQIADVFEGSLGTDTRPEPTDILDVSCDMDVLDPQHRILAANETVNDTTANKVVQGLLTGRPSSGAEQLITTATAEQVHYVCTATGLIDGGKDNTTAHGTPNPTNNIACARTNGICEDGGPGSSLPARCNFGEDMADCGQRFTDDKDVRVACPAGSEVIFFTLNNTTWTQTALAALPCQKDGSCLALYQQWKENGTLIQDAPAWRCTDQQRAYCDDKQLDLRDGKSFYLRTDPAAVYVPLEAEIASAFRYKTQFQNRSGSSVGFAPVVCIPGSQNTPYCYSPEGIEQVRARVDCLLDIWQNHYSALDATLPTSPRNLLNAYLKTNFSFTEEDVPGLALPVIHDGFERLNAELLIMLGDEAYTAAFASRFDLSGSRVVSFQGSMFESGGIDLSGMVGYEMYNLYLAAQYYQETLDRFYALSPLVWESLTAGSGKFNFITPDTITSYFDRLTRASTQKAKAYSEIARRYQGFNRQDLSRKVVERAYTGTYLEGVVLSRMMLRTVNVSQPEHKAQIFKAMEDAQRRYRVAMLEMRNVYAGIKDGTTFWGFTPDYVPMPALDVDQPNAFELVMDRAKEKLQLAREREDMALANGRSYETDAAQFQAELTRIRNSYESQLGELCGYITADDGRLYPAVEKYAQLSPRTRMMGDPCGLVGSGDITKAMMTMDQARTDMDAVVVKFDNLMAEIEIERDRISKQCKLVVDLADYQYAQAGRIKSIKDDIGFLKMEISAMDRARSLASSVANLMKCSMIVGTAAGGDCPMASAAVTFLQGTSFALSVASTGVEKLVGDKEKEITDINNATAYWTTMNECQVAQVDSNATTKKLLLRIHELDLERLRAQRNIGLAAAEIVQLKNQATRIAQELAEAEQMAINVEAARNDPNVRIYKNDAIINADIAFYDAAREAYRATKVFEYYTSQSYANLEKLFLVRMVARGDYNLENYLVELQNDFTTFEETYGNPDIRVAVVSLRDDILRVPKLDTNGTALTQADRTAILRQRLADVNLLDPHGYLTLPFSTSLASLSPLTRNHKVLYAEAEMVGSDVGDTVGRVYLRQQGTSVVRTVSDDKLYFRFPERTAVINPFFNGERLYTADVYRNYRLRDRPFINTSWELVINQVDELVNKDINLQSLTDVRLYVYYTDFTEL